jgi:hypothetical protein
MLSFRVVCVFGSVLAAASMAQAQVQWTSASGGNDHYYLRVDQTGLFFNDARLAAEAMTYQGLQGHLAVFETANYANEYNFVNTNVYSPGVASSRIYWVGAYSQSVSDPWFWTDGNQVPGNIVSSWAIDHFEGPGRSGIGFFQPNTTLWDYIETNSSGYVSGYIVEFEPVPEPGLGLGLGAAIAAFFGLRRKKPGKTISLSAGR